MSLPVTVSEGFAAAYERYAERVHSLAAHLSEEQFWTKPYPYGNSFGHLVLHLTGNLNHFIGAQLAGTGYVRDREREFNETSELPQDEVLGAFEKTIVMVSETLRAQTVESWSDPYEAEGASALKDRFGVVLNCVAHIHHHVGQMIYLEKELTKPVS